MSKYLGTAYRQSEDPKAPWVVTFVATAEEIREWAGIPRRTDETFGFQRVADQARVAQAKEFFNLSTNQSPTAIVVGLHPTAPGQTPRVQLTFAGETSPSTRRCELDVNFSVPASPADIRALLTAQIDHRLRGELGAGSPNFSVAQGSAEEVESDSEISEAEEGEDIEEADGPEEGTDASTEAGEPNGEIELGRSLLTKLKRELQDDEWIKANEESLVDLCKPATVIDGQHRLLGAEACERGIPFTVCAIVDCSWSEQIFQFTVINYTQRGIPDQFITANAALSLTRSELGHLKGRLVQARVKVLEYELMNVVNFDPKSPFYERVNLTERPDPTLIGYKTMVKVAKVWYEARFDAMTTILQQLYPTITGRGAAARRRSEWKERDWGDFFVAFWSVIRDHYAAEESHETGHTLWEVGHSQLMVAVVLFELQASFTQDLANQDEDFWKVPEEKRNSGGAAVRDDLLDKVRKRALKFVTWYPAALFATKWGTTSLNTGAGRRDLQDLFNKMRDKKGNYQYGKSALVTGKTS